MTIAHRPAHRAHDVILIGLEPPLFADEIVKVDVDLAALAAGADGFREGRRQDHLALVDDSRHGARDRPGAHVKGREARKRCGGDRASHASSGGGRRRAQSGSEKG
jgi:hypothetical protein